MFTRKLGRMLGLVFVLAATVGGVGAAAGAQYQSGAPTAVQVADSSITWE
ncbi:hypothetical protein [Paractinoplanes durhamensis]|nr:hypothetical protein [Actinoplanes durhamensis]